MRATALLLSLGVLLPSPALAGAALAGSAPPPNVGECPAGLGIGLLEVPKATLKDPRARNYVIDSVKPGATFTRKFEVCNGTHAPLTISMYPDAATIGHGVFSLAPGRGTDELTSWISVSPPSATVPSGRSLTAVMRFSVPIDATAGERYGGVLADAPGQTSGGVTARGRVGIRVYLNVGPGGAPKSDFTIDSLQGIRDASGTPAVLAQVHNTGARALDMRGSLSLSRGPGGLSAGPFPARLGTTLKPGDSAPVLVPLNKAIRGGPWHAVIDMLSGVLERKAEGDITFPDKPSTAAPAVKAHALPLYKDRGILVPIAIGFISLLLLLLLLLALKEYLRRQRQRTA